MIVTNADLLEMRARWIEVGRPANSQYRRAVETAPENVRATHLMVLPLLFDDPAKLRERAETER